MVENTVREHKPPWVVILKKLSKNKLGLIGTALIVFLILIAISAPFLEPYSYKEQNIENMNEPPSLTHFLGTDDFGGMY